MAVLLVEDDTMVRLTLADFFEIAGLTFLEARNAEEALAIIDDPTQAINVLVTDLDLGPGDDGLALAIKARQRRPDLLVVYETGTPEMFAGHAFGPWEKVFYKPYNPRDLAATVVALNSQGRLGRCPQRPAAMKTVASSL